MFLFAIASSSVGAQSWPVVEKRTNEQATLQSFDNLVQCLLLALGKAGHATPEVHYIAGSLLVVPSSPTPPPPCNIIRQTPFLLWWCRCSNLKFLLCVCKRNGRESFYYCVLKRNNSLSRLGTTNTANRGLLPSNSIGRKWNREAPIAMWCFFASNGSLASASMSSGGLMR